MANRIIYNRAEIVRLRPPENTPPRVEKKIDIAPLEQALSKGDLPEIFKNPLLFWLAFCKESSKLNHTPRDIFSVSLSGNSLTVNGPTYIVDSVQKTVNGIRNCFLKCFNEKRDFSLIPIGIAGNCYLREKHEVIHLENWQNNKTSKIVHAWFNQCIRPALEGLSKTVGATCSNIQYSQKIKYDNHTGITAQNVDGFSIAWLRSLYFVYPLPPNKISPGETLAKSTYVLYQKQILCDLTLKAKDGELKMHSLLLLAQGGDVMQCMLTGNMKEANEKRIRFETWSLNTIKAFVDFIYLGQECLSPESIQKNGVDVWELFEFASTYIIPDLVDCSTNLISLFATSEDLEKIKAYVDLHENTHLKKLYHHFSLTDSRKDRTT